MNIWFTCLLILKMMWAADFDESLASHLEANCPDLLAIQIPRDSGAEIEQETVENNDNDSKSGSFSRKGNLVHSVSDNTLMKSESAHPFCGLAKSFWSKNDHLHIGSAISTTGNGDDELPVFCVAAVLIMNRQKIIKETRSIDDLIKVGGLCLCLLVTKRPSDHAYTPPYAICSFMLASKFCLLSCLD